jgi:hypothetical protein
MMQPVERRVQIGTVKALAVVQDDQLPVRFHVVCDSPTEPQVLHSIGGESLRQIS